MRHIKKQGSNNHLIIMLHGTGGQADDLFGIGNIIDKDATFIGLEGEVFENEMRRWFERYPDGTFKLKSLAENTKKLYLELIKIIDVFSNKEITVMGYSNGSNIFLNVLKEHENIKIDHAILYHPSAVRPEVEFKNQTMDILITSGANDPFITAEEFNHLKQQLTEQDIKVDTFTHNSGHQLVQEELDYTKQFLKE